MEISSFSRMRSYRNDGRTSALLKLVLPRMSEDGSEEPFNTFYASLAEFYSSLAEGISKRVERDGAPTVVSVGFEVLTDIPTEHKHEKHKENLLIIKRTHRIRRGAEIESDSFVDLFDTERKIFVK